jgi:flagellin-like hook-associated protein FlgL
MVRSLNSSISTMRAINAFKGASRVASSQLSKLSSGSRIPNAKEDVASLSISKGISLEISALKSARNNLLQASSMLQMADSALGDVSDILTRMEALATIARNGTNSPTELMSLDLEYQQLIGAMDSIVDGTEFNGRSLLGEQPEFRMGVIDADVDSDDGFAGYSLEPNFPMHQAGDFFEISYDSTTRNMTLHHERTDRYQTVSVPTSLVGGDIEDVRFEELGVTIKLSSDFNAGVDIDPTIQNSDIAIATNAVTGTSFVPSDLPNLVLNVSAEDSPLFTTGSGVQNAGDLETFVGGNNALIQNNAGLQPDVVASGVFGRDAFDFDGSEFFAVNDNSSINASTHAQKTIAMSFRSGGDVASRQVIWEEGATVNGMNVYIDAGQLYFGVYRSNGANGTWLSTPINPSTDYTMSATYDNATNSTSLYLNGAQVALGAGIGAPLPSHTGNIGVGRTNDTTVYHDGASGADTDYFTGRLAEIIYYDDAIGSADHAELATYMSTFSFTEVLFNSEEIDIQAASGADVVDRIALDIPKMAEQVFGMQGTNILSDSAANASHEAIRNMMDEVNAARADMGSLMNRFAFAEGVVSISLENQSQAESVLSDADIAKEMTSFMSQNLLLETASEMILKGRESGQYVLSLLDNSLGQ